MRSGEETQSTKCIMKIFIVLGYEGPNLSESAISFTSGRSRDSRPRRSRYQGSDTSSGRHRRALGHHARSGSSVTESNASVSQYGDMYGRLQEEGAGDRRDDWSRQRSREARPWEDRRLHGNESVELAALTEGSLDSNTNGRLELERRWLLETSRSSSDPSQEAGGSNPNRVHLHNSSLRMFQRDQFQELTNLVQSHLSPDDLRCSQCKERLVDLRFVCKECGPLRDESGESAPAKQEVSPTKISITEDSTQPTRRKYDGYELCEVCVESSAHGCEQQSGQHAFIEAHKALDSRGWRVVGKSHIRTIALTC